MESPPPFNREAEKEALLLSKLHHPNIVTYLESFLEDRNLFIVMEFADGGKMMFIIVQTGSIHK